MHVIDNFLENVWSRDTKPEENGVLFEKDSERFRLRVYEIQGSLRTPRTACMYMYVYFSIAIVASYILKTPAYIIAICWVSLVCLFTPNHVVIYSYNLRCACIELWGETRIPGKHILLWHRYCRTTMTCYVHWPDRADQTRLFLCPQSKERRGLHGYTRLMVSLSMNRFYNYQDSR